jgi:hypothetical protein
MQAGQLWRGHLAAPKASQVSVRVLNGTGIPGLARQTGGRLRKLGFKIVHVGNAPATAATTLSYPAGGQAGGAYALTQALIQAPSVESGIGGGLTLTIGADFAGVRVPPRLTAKRSRDQAARGTQHADSPPDGSPPAVQARNAATNICSGMPAANPQVGTPP